MAGFYVNLLIFGLLALFSPKNCKANSGICGSPRPDGSPNCCPFFYADGKQCVECLAGYQSNKGKNCTEPCDFPGYGAHCQGTCNCSQGDCHHVNGCFVTGTTESPVTTTLFSANGTTSVSTSSLETTTETTSFSDTGTIAGNSVATPACVDELVKDLFHAVGAVLVVIMIIINIVNIHNYMKHQKEEPIEEDV